MEVECFAENNYSDNVHVVTASSHLNFNILLACYKQVYQVYQSV